MDYFEYRNGRLHAEGVPLSGIAEEFGTPCYVYSRATLERHYRVYDEALGETAHQIYYAVKANGNLALLNLLARLGAGFDIVSGGELHRVLLAGGDPVKIVFSGVGKRDDEMRQALETGIHCFNVESEPELQRLSLIAQQAGRPARIALRVNPDVDAQTHPYIATGLRENKFGIEIERALAVYQDAARMPGIEIAGVACHIGSQINSLEPFLEALNRLLVLVDSLTAAGIRVEHVDIGGGLGVRYRDEQPPEPAEQAAALRPLLNGRDLELHIEPGRVITGNAGILLTRVEYLKETTHKRFAVVDAAMNDLLRPTLYDAWHDIEPVQRHKDAATQTWDVVGPVCETGDWFGKQRELALREQDLLAVRTAGAYGFVMSSNYNARPRPAEVMVDGDAVYLVRTRETLDDLVRGEAVLPD